jgi:arylsulfatase A-like enzyme
VIETPVSLHELAPTITEAAGADEDAAYDGQSLWPLLRGEHVTDRPPQFWHFPAYLEAGAAVDGRWRTTPVSVIRVGNWKLLEFHETGATEFYDLGVDPGETTDLSAEKPIAHDALLGLLRAWRYDTDAPMPKPRSTPT